MLTLRQIEVIRAIMVTGSIAGAARLLNVAAPGISRLMKYSEDSLGVRLFDRRAGRYVPTPQARNIFDLLDTVHRKIEDLQSAVADLGRGNSQELCIASVPSIANVMVPRAIAGLRRRYPDLGLDINILKIEEAIDYLLLGRGEAVAISSRFDHPLIQFDILASGRLLCIVPESSPLASRGAGSGIGRAIARAFAHEGAHVVAVGLSEGISETVDACVASGGRASSVVVDLGDQEAARQVILDGSARLADILVNNAGIGGARSIYDTDDDEIDRFLNINLRSVFRLSRSMVRAWRDGQRPGAIVNIASVQGLLGFPRNSSYAVSKSGLIGLTRQMANDCAAFDVRVNAVAPGIIETPLTAERLRDNTSFRAVSVGATPMRRAGRAEEVAAACVFLASDEASFITGQVLAVDGGASATVFRETDAR